MAKNTEPLFIPMSSFEAMDEKTKEMVTVK